MEFTTTQGAEMTATAITAAQFTYNVHSDEDAADFFSLMQRAGVQAERISAMQKTREEFLAGEAR